MCSRCELKERFRFVLFLYEKEVKLLLYSKLIMYHIVYKYFDMYDMCKNKDNFIVHVVFVSFSISEEQS